MANIQQTGQPLLTEEEKHEQARAFALSGSLSTFQRRKQRKSLLETTTNNNQVVQGRKSQQTKKAVKVSSRSKVKSTKKQQSKLSSKENEKMKSKELPPLVVPPYHNTEQEQRISTGPGPILTASPLVTNTTTSSSYPILDAGEDPQTDWAPVQYQDWQYVYVCSGPYRGRFGYYDDHYHHSHEKDEKDEEEGRERMGLDLFWITRFGGWSP